MDDAKRDTHAAMASGMQSDEDVVSTTNGASSGDGLPTATDTTARASASTDAISAVNTQVDTVTTQSGDTVAVAQAPSSDGGAAITTDEALPTIAGANGSEASAIVDGEANGSQEAYSPIMGRPVRSAADLEAGAGPMLVSEDGVPAYQEPITVVQADRRPIWSVILSTIVGSRWILAIPAVWLAITTGQSVEQMRLSLTGRPAEPPPDSWQNFALAGLLLVIAVFPRRLPIYEGPRAYFRRLRTRNLEGWLDLAVLIGASALISAGIVYVASGALTTSSGAQSANVIPTTELPHWAVTTWLWPFLQVSTSNLPPLQTLVIAWAVIFVALVLVGLLATFIPGLRPAGPSVFLRELTYVPDAKRKTETLTPTPEAETTTEAVAVEGTTESTTEDITPAQEVISVQEATPIQAVASVDTPPAQEVTISQSGTETDLSDKPLAAQEAILQADGLSMPVVALSSELPATTSEQTTTELSTKLDEETKSVRPRRRLSWRRVLLFFVPLALSLLCLGASIPLFTQLNMLGDGNVIASNWWINNGSWFLWLAAMALFGLAFVLWERTTRPPEEGDNANAPLDRFPRWLEWAIMLSLLGVAFYFRVKDLDVIPAGLWFDEGQDGIVGRDLLSPNGAHRTFIGDWTQMGALLWYFMGIANKFLGDTVLSVRIIPAIAGALIAPMLYMLAARLYGWRAGLVAGGLVAVMDWNLTWSRIGMASIPTVAMVVAVYLCMVQALRTGRLGYYAGAGILLGLALHMYYVSKLVPVVILAMLVHKLITERMRLIRSIRVGAVVFAVGALMAFAPVGLFAQQRPNDYNARTDIVSIFSTMNSPTADALRLNLESNVRAHFFMFNWVGDGNGRHNLSGTPMLDWITAALFFAGLASCLLRVWRWQYAFPVVWSIAGISGGVFTLPFEAPQSHRALELSVVAPLIAGIFIGQAWEAVSGAHMMERIGSFFNWLRQRTRSRKGTAFQEVRRPILWPARVGWVISGATLLYVVWLAGGLNTYKYFEVQAKDLGVVKDMQAPQAEAAKQTLLFGSEYDVFVTPLWQGIPQAQYLARNVNTIAWPGLHALPLSPGKPGGTIIILDLPSVADMRMIARLYPNAHFDIYTAASNPEPLVITVKVPDEDIKANRGVLTSVSEGGSSKASSPKLLPTLSYDWSAPGGRPGTVRLSTTLKVDQFGSYVFSLESASGNPSAAQLLIDGYKVTPGTAIELAMGLHSVVVTDTVTTASGVTQLLWTPPPGGVTGELPALNLFDPRKVEPHGLTGYYRPGTAYEGAATIVRNDPVISYYFHNTPLPLPFTTEWVGSIYIPEDGSYVFGSEQLSTSQLYIDGQLLVDNKAINNLQQGTVQLTTGFHDLRLLYLDSGSASHVYLYWTPPGRAQSLIPSIFLWPKMGQYPDEPESGEWPTLEESDGRQIPPDRVTYTPPRTEEVQTKPQPGSVNPPPAAPPAAQAPVSKGDQFKPTLLIGDSSIVPGRPRAGGVDKDGNLYIFAERESKIYKFDSEGKLLTSWAVKNSVGPVTEGSSLIVKDDRIYVLDSSTSDLIGSTLDGQAADSIHLCTCFFPRDATLSNDGNFWLANTGNGQVLKISTTGSQLASVGQKGENPGEFNEPAGVAEAQNGTLFVMDTSNKRVQSFDSDYKPVAQWSVGPSIARDGNRLAADSQGNVLVTQSEGHAIVRYDKNGKELNRWVYRRSGIELIPAGIAALGDDKFLVMFPEQNLAAVFSPEEK